jgi:hypothetical protein
MIHALPRGTGCPAIQAERGLTLMRDDSAGISWVPAQAVLYISLRKP